jgi:signal transduction histidine kinase/DNA-binding response OmpR family regulator
LFKNEIWASTLHSKACASFQPGAALAASDGVLYFGSSDYRKGNKGSKGGVICAIPDAAGYRFVHRHSAQAPRNIKAIAEDAHGRIWLCGDDLWVGGSEGFEKCPPIIEGDREGQYIDMASAGNGVLWVARRGKGIFRFKDDRWEAVNEGLPEKFSHSLLCDPDTTWISCSAGISRYQGACWSAHLFSDDFPGRGMQINNIRKDLDKTYWFNSVPDRWTLSLRTKVYTNIAPSEFKCIQYTPQDSPPDTKIVFSADRVAPPGNAILEWIGTSPWHATQREHLYYSYRINRGGWSPFTMETRTTLLALKSGTYTFEVRARDDDFNVDPTPASVTFRVIPPIWRQAWFLILLCSMVSLLLLVLRAHQQRLVSEQKLQTEIERIKLRFFTSISHELRTPLTVLLGPLKRVYEDEDDPAKKNTLSMMMRNGEKLRTLINQILDFRKLEAGKMKIMWSYGDFIQSAQSIYDALLAYAEMANVTCCFEAPKASCMVWFDPDKLQILLNNLISNAIKYTPVGGHIKVIVLIEYKEDASGKNMPFLATVRVEDTGPGISAKEQDHIFERYYRSDSAENKGSGLGLALVKDLTQLLGGRISVESPVAGCEQGACFILKLPIYTEHPEGADRSSETIEENPSPSAKSTVPSGDDQSEKPTVLVIDDDEDIRMFIRSELSSLYLIQEAADGREGVKLAGELIPDLIISDVMMPLMDGTQLCSELKANELTSHIPIILLTARAAQESELEGLQAGADDYVTKPFSIDLLKARIYALLTARKAMQERFSQSIQLGSLDLSLTSADRVFIEQFIALIEERMADFELTTEQLAQELNIHERSLQRKIKAMTGETPSTLIRHIRLNSAKKLMDNADSGLIVSEVASAVGIMNVNYFGRMYKNQFGETPSATLAKNRK